MSNQNKLLSAYDQLLDVRELLCPIPLLKTKQALKKLTPGQVLKVLATDPATEKDLRSLLMVTHDQLLFFECHAHVLYFLIKKTETTEKK